MAKSPPDEDKRGALEDAKEFLVELLSDGPVEAETVHTKAKSREIKFATMRRAKKVLKVESVKESEAWFWRLPKATMIRIQAAARKVFIPIKMSILSTLTKKRSFAGK